MTSRGGRHGSHDAIRRKHQTSLASIHFIIRRSRRPDSWTTIDADFRWHIEILPRLTGVAGFEFGTGFYINPTLPEEAANVLREATLHG